MRFIVRLAINMLTFLLLSMIFPSGFRVDSWGAALLAAFVLSILNAIIKPILTILTLPLTILTFGFFAIVVNAMLLEVTADFVGGFEFSSFGWAMIIALIVSIINTFLTKDLHVQVERH
ncbi:phage holin family protein [Leuconostoc mesenteroides]|uniref:Phage holin family protein n=1 Tax=Leuconostoc mesenteroides TaxID=1245 RepID=A0A843YZK4_LEUME|nr:phage holin family protein [Leuconostoc mesenteroides]MCI2166499.1 phage holin family protein [Leuconostoc mesenteroides]MDP0486576.1 phage holin family protein [Leuconostoc mesenteroides]MQR25805.1 phage holin family protein [Leuconostoc mesenteroides]TDV92790.1 putative membrane protein [Leuconostoc mesenteroides]WMS40315.1 phage holin family protein [Leuconostoc mesenteroides]